MKLRKSHYGLIFGGMMQFTMKRITVWNPLSANIRILLMATGWVCCRFWTSCCILCRILSTSISQSTVSLPNSHYSDVIMSKVSSQIPGVSMVCSAVYLGVDQRKHQRSASVPFVRGIQRWHMNSPHKGPVARKMFPYDDVIVGSRQMLGEFLTWVPREQKHL